jgi:hypothetical protein
MKNQRGSKKILKIDSRYCALPKNFSAFLMNRMPRG